MSKVTERDTAAGPKWPAHSSPFSGCDSDPYSARTDEDMFALPVLSVTKYTIITLGQRNLAVYLLPEAIGEN
jgi:hypothetical protein